MTELAASSPRADSHPLAEYGWNDRVEADFAPYALKGLLPGRVVRVDRGRCEVVTLAADGSSVLALDADPAPVASRDPMWAVCAGDWVALDPDADPAAVRVLLPRRTAFVRSTSSKRSEGQVLATNIDYAVIAISLAVELELERVERFLALAWECGAQPMVVMTKSDLIHEPETLRYLSEDIRDAAPDVPVLAVSSQTGAGLDELAAQLSDGTSVLLGQSGAGKSTLANALVGQDLQEVKAARDSDGKGRHTTTRRDLLVLPGGGTLIDTPGLRGVGLWDAAHGLSLLFSDVEDLAESCRFHDCSHTAEPRCAVLAAVAEGELSPRRLESYRKLTKENEWIAERIDVRQREEVRRNWKRGTKRGTARD
ncbi:ribosome small subunit-dependent GTPase A [Streptomyces sp. NPDC046465]|uniref:ribosome small subunit-dependent GTPase A n=1 Tax=Streptomyces sp. NPDC046465 TaxID=3155810 RepID=UPI00340D69ED